MCVIIIIIIIKCKMVNSVFECLGVTKAVRESEKRME